MQKMTDWISSVNVNMGKAEVLAVLLPFLNIFTKQEFLFSQTTDIIQIRLSITKFFDALSNYQKKNECPKN